MDTRWSFFLRFLTRMLMLNPTASSVCPVFKFLSLLVQLSHSWIVALILRLIFLVMTFNILRSYPRSCRVLGLYVGSSVLYMSCLVTLVSFSLIVGKQISFSSYLNLPVFALSGLQLCMSKICRHDMTWT